MPCDCEYMIYCSIVSICWNMKKLYNLQKKISAENICCFRHIKLMYDNTKRN